jgi:cell division protein FtsI (penicillin-binding protein 3)
MDSIFGDPTDIKDASLVAGLLSRVLNIPAVEIETKIREAKTPVRLAKKLSPETVQRIGDMNLKGVFFQKENRRVYPQRQSLAHALGYVDTDEKGIGGIEYAFDKQIRGKPGRMMVMADGKRRWYDRSEAAADPGASVVLTVDETIQFIAEKELARGMQETHSKYGTVVIQNPNTGELLAFANAPTFDPNDAGSYPDEVRMDRGVSAAYEPGSTFKVITMTGALENGVTNPDEMIDCQMGSIVVAGRLIHDWHPFGILSVRDVLANSSDVGSIKVAMRLGAPKFYDVIHSFGIGQLTGIELPGENRGILRPVDNWMASAIGSVAIGQEVSVTPVQIISAISAVANGGMLYKPRIVKEIQGGSPLLVVSHPAPQQVTDATTAATVRGMMETVVLSGTGKLAQLNGYTAAGKSGTAQQIDPNTGRYSPNKYIASFVGFAPVNEPAMTILIVFDSPEGAHHGGEIGGPVFKRIAEQVLAYMDVDYDIPGPSAVQTAKNAKHPHEPEEDSSAGINQARFKAAKDQPDSLEATSLAVSDEDAVVIPDLAGQTVRGVTEECSRLGLAPSLIGSGVALEQSPEAGARVPRGSRVAVRFGRMVADARSKDLQRNVN